MILIIFLIILIHLALLAKLLYFPYPELFIYPYLTKIGFLPYKQIFDQHFPGIMFFPVNLATLGVDTPEKMRIVSYFLVAVSHIVLYLISRQLFRNKQSAIFPNLMFVLWQPLFEGYVLWVDSFVAPILLLSFYFAVKKDLNSQKRNMFLSGLFLGMALLFKQVVLPLIVIYMIYLIWKKTTPRSLLMFSFGISIPILYLIYFVINKRIISDFVYWTYTFNMTVFAQMGRKYFSIHELIKVLPLFGAALAGIVYFLATNIKKLKRSLFVPLSIYFVGSLAFAYARQDYVHLQPALPFAILSVCYFTYKINKLQYRKYLFLLMIVSLILVLPSIRSLSSKEVKFWGAEDNKITSIVKGYTHPGDSIFAFGTFPDIYQRTLTKPSGNIFVFQFPWFMKVVRGEILGGLKTDPPKVVILDRQAEVNNINLTDYNPEIMEYLSRYYHTADIIGNTQILLPN